MLTKKVLPTDIGSRATSERSSNLSGREGFDLKLFSERMLQEENFPVMSNRSRRTVRNPLHEDYVQFLRPVKAFSNNEFKGARNLKN